METTDIIEQVQLLAKCDISKEDLTDAIEYFREDQEDITCENMPSMSQDQSIPDGEYEPPEKISVHETVPYDIKLKIQRFKKHLQRPLQLTRYKNAVLSGGTFRDKLNAIKANWAIAADAQYNDTKQKSEKHTNIFRFVASSTWLIVFLRKHRISNRRVVRCEYRVNVSQTYTHTGEKLIQLYIGDLNKVFHSYIAKYSMTKFGKLLNKVFVCLQEFTDSFGVRVQKDVVYRKMSIERKGASLRHNTGKLTTSSLYEQYLRSVVEPYVGNNLFLFIVNSWGGQKNIQIYNEIFHDENNKPTCNLQIIPPKCTPICQPCDVYIFIGNMQLNTRADAIRIQSLTHYLLSASRFKCMLQYA
ncbi:hypothetical protein ACFW04_011769 [Cataglyphis niger]